MNQLGISSCLSLICGLWIAPCVHANEHNDGPAAMLCAVEWDGEFSPLFAAATDEPIIEPWAAPNPAETTPSRPVEQEPGNTSWRPEAFLAFAYGDEGEVLSAHVGAAYEFDPVNRVEIVPQLGFGVAQNTDDDRPVISSFDLQMRWTPWEHEGWEAFLEWGAGLQYVGPESFPRSGTHANGRLRAGAGVRYFLEERADLIAGVGWLHMSNGNALDPNVGHDGPMFYLGLTWQY